MFVSEKYTSSWLRSVPRRPSRRLAGFSSVWASIGIIFLLCPLQLIQGSKYVTMPQRNAGSAYEVLLWRLENAYISGASTIHRADAAGTLVFIYIFWQWILRNR